MDFALSDEDRMLKDLVARFVREELQPLERMVLEREAMGQGTSLTSEERAPIDRKAVATFAAPAKPTCNSPLLFLIIRSLPHPGNPRNLRLNTPSIL